MSDAPTPETTLPRRDCWLLPSVVVSVTCAFLGASEAVAGLMFADRGQFTCETADQVGPGHQKPNCVSYFKNAEGPIVQYRFNECGYRSEKPCGTKPRNTLRVVLMGTSVTLGLFVPSDETFAARTERALNRMCSRAVEVQNMGSMARLPSQPELVDEALRLSPDVIVLTVVPFDIQATPAAAQQPDSQSRTGIARIMLAWSKLKLNIDKSKFMFAAEHFMLLDEQTLYQTYLNNGSSRDVMSSPQTPSGERSFAEFGATLDRVMAKLRGSDVPLIVMAVPNRVAAAVVSNGSHLEGTDAGWFGHHISEIAVQHGALPLDVTPEFAKVPHAEQLFYPVDNHPTGGAHAIIARALVDRLTGGSIPQLCACHSSRPEGY